MSTPQKIALVTGGYRGLAQRSCGSLRRGTSACSSAAVAKRARKACADIGTNVAYLPLDVSDEDSVRKGARQVSEQVDHLDILVNNAAILLDDGGSALELTARVALETFSPTLLVH